MRKITTAGLFIQFAAAVIMYLFIRETTGRSELSEWKQGMIQAAGLSAFWMTGADSLARAVREEGSYPEDQQYGGLIGPEFSEIVTTLGNPEAKITSLNPWFAALIYRYLRESRIDSNSIVAVQASGSFPALTISSLAALKTINAKVHLMSSIGASMYGAADTTLAWLEIEKHLIEHYSMPYRSETVTAGGDDENGGGLPLTDPEIFRRIAIRAGYKLYIPVDLEEVINYKYNKLIKAKTLIVINIGGSHSMLGNCSHVLKVKPGLNEKLPFCNHKEQGLMFRLNNAGIPVIHLLNIRDLAASYGFEIAPARFDKAPANLFFETTPSLYAILISLILLPAVIIITKKYCRSRSVR